MPILDLDTPLRPRDDNEVLLVRVPESDADDECGLQIGPLGEVTVWSAGRPHRCDIPVSLLAGHNAVWRNRRELWLLK